MHNPDHNASPFNAMPPVVLVLAAAILGIELIFQAGAHGFAGGPQGVGWRIEAFNRFAFLPGLFDHALATGQWSPGVVMRFFSYVFVHQGLPHVAFVLVFLLALGKYVGELFHPLALLAIFFGSAAIGALVYGSALETQTALIGGYPAVYGLIGAYTFVLWVGLGAVGQNRARAFMLIGFLMAFQLVFGLLLGGGMYWVAELSGFGAGFVLSFLVSPGGWGRIMASLRQR